MSSTGTKQFGSQGDDKSQQRGQRTQSDSEAIAIIQNSGGQQPLQPKLGATARQSFHLRDPETGQEMLIEIGNRTDVAKQASQTGSSRGQSKVWEVVTSNK